MQLKCLLCNAIKTSKIIGDEKEAFADLINLLNKHVLIKHPREAFDIQKYINEFVTLALSFLTIEMLIDIESEETSGYIKNRYEELEKKIAEIMGYDVVEEEEKDEEKDSSILVSSNNSNDVIQAEPVILASTEKVDSD
jgi:hypothetical protein